MVGPHGYIHGWIFVGAPGIGTNVFHPQHGHGTVTGHSSGHVTVAFGSRQHTFEHTPHSPIEPATPVGAPHLEPRPESRGGAAGVMTAAEAKKWGNSNWPGRKDLPADQYKALTAYSGPGAFQINRYLRTGKIPVRGGESRTPNPAEKRQLDTVIASIEKAAEDHPTPSQAMVVHRGTGLAEFGNVTPDKLIGHDVQEPAFLSTSVGKRLSEMFGREEVHLAIKVPAGTPAFYLDKVSSHPGERELLLGKGLRYRIVSARKIRGQWQVEAEIIRSPGATVTRAAGMVTNPGGTERLHQYWVHGEGAAKIGWGQPGDFDRCVLELGKYIDDAKGYCNLAHKAATGMYPAQHAAMEHGRAAMATDTKAKPYGDVTYADPKNGKYPIDTEEHARAAWSYINQAKNAGEYPMNGVTLSEVKDRIMAACRKFGIDVSDGDGSSGRAESLAPFYRDFPLTDLSVRSGGRDGRIVSAYAAVFDTPTEIHDQDGDYYEVIDPTAFNRAISDARPQGNRKGWKVGVFYNHGRTLAGTPSDRHSMPIGVPISITADSTGVLTETQYHRSDFCEEIVEGLESGAIPGYSFSGMFRRSHPLIPRGGFRRDRGGSLQTVRRTESTLREYGPTPFPAYTDAAIVGMRAETIFAAMASDPELAQRMASMLRDGALPDQADSPPPSGAPQEVDSPAEDSQPVLVRSGRSLKQEMQAERSAFLQRYRR